MIYLSIDVGIINLAIVKARVENFHITNILEARTINLNLLQHNVISKENCLLHHSNDIYDKMQHLFQEFNDLFQNIDFVLIERQPITGLVHVEQLLYGKFRSIARLVSPNSMHKWLNIRQYTYEQRKIETTKIAEPYLRQCADWMNSERVHDMADSLCILLFVLHTESTNAKIAVEEKIKEKHMTEFKYDGETTIHDFFENFRYSNTNI